MMFSWPTMLAAFLASLVEFVEALTIVLAVGAVRGWQAAMAGAVAAAALLALLIGAFGPHLAQLNERIFQLVIGILLLLFGLRWLRKAILRAAGIIALHDEDKEFREQEEALRGGAATKGFDYGAALTSFNGVFVEGIEVVFIVLGFGAAGKQMGPAVIGASAAAVLVVLLGLVARRPLSNIPENALKLVVGVLVSAFGTLWTGEGIGLTSLQWVWSPLVLSLGYLIVAGLGILLARPAARKAAV